MKTPWTSGPWLHTKRDKFVCDYIDDSNGNALAKVGGMNVDDVENKSNAALIALAPEMAEAILAWESNSHGDCVENLEKISRRLREIGGK